MVQQDQMVDLPQMSQMISWLEEQRKLDKEQVTRALQEVDRLAIHVKELASQLQQIGDDAKAERARLSTIPFAEEGIRQLREQVSVLQQRVDARDQAHDRETVLRQAEMEREKKLLVDLTQQLVDLQKRDEQHQAKLQTMAEDVRRGRTDLLPLAERLDVLERNSGALVGRSQLLDEQIRRLDARTTVIEHDQETAKTELARLVQWQQAAELRWTRQISHWQEQMDEWKRELGDHVKSIQLLAKQVSQTRDELQQLRSGISKNHQQIESQAAEFVRMENVRAHDREDATRIEQGLELQRRRVDEQSGALKKLQEQILQNGQDFADLAGRLDSERKRVDETGIHLRQIEQTQKRALDEMVEMQKLLREQNHAIAQQAQAWQQQLEFELRQLEEQIAGIHHLSEQQKLREAAEVERQVMEIREHIARPRARGTS